MGPADTTTTTKDKQLFRAALLAALPANYQGRHLPHGRKIVRLRDLRPTCVTGNPRPGIFMDGNPANLSQPVLSDQAVMVARISPRLWQVVELDDCLLPLDGTLRALFCKWLSDRYGVKVPTALIEPPAQPPLPALVPPPAPAPAAIEPPPAAPSPLPAAEEPPPEPIAAAQQLDRGSRRRVTSQAEQAHGVRR